MPSTYSSNLKIELMSTGENSGTWGNITNTNLGTALEQAVVGYGAVSYASDANLTISITNSNAAQAARALVLNVTSAVSLTGTRELVVPTIEKQYIVQNNTTGSQSITVKTSAGTGITVPNGRKAHLYVDGTNVIQMFDFVDINGGTIDGTPIGGSAAAAGAFTTLNASGATTLDGNVTLGNASGDNVTVTGTITSHLLFTDNTYDIGANGATRPRNLFLAGAATIGGNLSVGGTLTLTGGLILNGNVTVGDNASDTLTINSTITSNLIFTDNTYDIGASGATRPRNLFLAGNATIGGNQTLTGSLTVDSTTDSSSTTTGSIQTDGGLGVAKALYVGTTANIAGNVTLSGGTANGVAYLNGSKVLTTGSALTFDGTEFKVNAASGNVLIQPSNVASAKLYMRHGSIANNNGFEVDVSSNTIFLQAGSEAMRLTSTGLGIGTSSPSQKLAVAGNISVGATGNNGIQFHSGSPTGGNLEWWIANNQGASNELNFYYYSGGGSFAGNAMSLTKTGNVGIGTSSPSTNLEVSGSSAVARISGTFGTVPQLSLSSAGVVNWTLRSNNDGGSDLTIYQDATQRLKIDSNGYVGIRTSSPAGFLHVAPGSAAAASTAGAPIILQAQTGGSSAAGGNILIGSGQNGSGGSNGYIAFGIGSSTSGSAFATGEAMRITSAGNFGFNTTTPTAVLSGSNVLLDAGNANGAEYIARRTGGGAVLAAGVTSSNTGYLWMSTNTNLLFGTNNTERARITGTGSLLVGQTTLAYQAPADSIQANGSFNTGGFGRIQTPGQQIGSATYAGLYGMANLYLAYYSGGWKSLGGGTASAVTIDEGIFSFSNSQNIAAADTALTWTTRLTINSTSTDINNGYVKIGSPSTSTDEFWLQPGSTEFALRGRQAKALTFWTSDVERARITSGGQLLAGRTSGINNGTIEALGTGQQAFVGQVTNNNNSTFQGFSSGGDATFQVTGAGDLQLRRDDSGPSFSLVNANMQSGERVGRIAFVSNGVTAQSSYIDAFGGSSADYTDLRFSTSNGGVVGERARITSGGQLLVGTTSTGGSYPLQAKNAGLDGTSTALSSGVTTTIYTIPNIVTAAFVVVFADNGSSGFCDTLIFLASTNPVVLSSSTLYGAPPARTYSMASTTQLRLNVAMACTARVSVLGTS